MALLNVYHINASKYYTAFYAYVFIYYLVYYFCTNLLYLYLQYYIAFEPYVFPTSLSPSPPPLSLNKCDNRARGARSGFSDLLTGTIHQFIS